MFEFLQQTVMPLNLPFTVIFGLTMLYWLAVILGGIDLEFLDADITPDIDVDGSGGFLSSITEFLSLGEVPIMFVVTLMVMSCWWFSLILNYFLNPSHSILLGLAFLIPNFIVSFFITAFIMKPLAKMFKQNDQRKESSVMYQVGTVVTSQVNSSFGQVEILTGGAPITIHARTTGGGVLIKGDKALVYDEDRENGVYFVEKYNEE